MIESPRPAPSLRAAVRTARVEEAERSLAVADLRGAELARLDMLREAIEPVLAQVPEGIDLFDAGLMPGERPRLFIDMIAFVEMAHDKRTYRFVQDSRNGRRTLAESERLEAVAQAVTDYIARRLVDREKALASERAEPPPAPLPLPVEPPAEPARAGFALAAFRIVLEYLGIVALCVLLWMLARYGFTVWQSMPGR